jgi:uncharacterized cupredoxin-like copper-binding protein
MRADRGDLFAEYSEELGTARGKVAASLTRDCSRAPKDRERGHEARRALAESGERKTAEATLPAGGYNVYCALAGHEAAGVNARLTVLP